MANESSSAKNGRNDKESNMKYLGVCIAVNDINLARKFYEDLFGLEVVQDYGINISFSCGLALQQDFDWIIDVPKEKILKEPHNMELYFEEDDFEGFLKKLENYPNIKYLRESVKEFCWGQRTIGFYDLDGHIIEVGENMKMVIQRFLDSGMSMDEISKRTGISVPDLEMFLSGAFR